MLVRSISVVRALSSNLYMGMCLLCSVQGVARGFEEVILITAACWNWGEGGVKLRIRKPEREAD